MEFIANYGSGSEEESEQVGSGSEGENEEVKAPRKQKSYSAEFKLKVVKFAKDNDKAKAAVKFGVDRKQVRNWVKQENQLHQIKNSPDFLNCCDHLDITLWYHRLLSIT